MIPITPEELRLKAAGWPLDQVCLALAAALPGVDTALLTLTAHWLTSEQPEAEPPPLSREQVAAIWRARQGRAY